MKTLAFLGIVLSLTSLARSAPPPRPARIVAVRAPDAIVPCGTRGHPYSAPHLLTRAPGDVTSANGITPLGNINPQSAHVRPNDHMHVGYPNPANGGADIFPVFAMADGRIVMITEDPVTGRSDPDIQIWIRHTPSITSYFAHQTSYSSVVQPIIDSIAPSAWQSIDASRILVFGQHGAPPPPRVLAGQQVTSTRSYIYSWDVGVIDSCVPHPFEGEIRARYSDYFDLAAIAGLTIDPIPFPGNHTVHAQCFLDYMSDALRAQWLPKLDASPQRCGQVTWDLPGRLRGNWTNPAIDEGPPEALFDVERASISFTPDVRLPATGLQIGIGSASAYSVFDPSGSLPQLGDGFRVAIDFSPSSRINPDPAAVRPSTGTVCYDLPYNVSSQSYNRLYVSMSDDRTIRAALDPTPRPTPPCASSPLPDPDPGWATFVR
jgi:hypothetical protein